MNTLDESGKCKHCDKDAQSEFMECWVCREKYHVIECASDKEPMIQPSFLKNNWPNLQRKYPCVTFTCDSCREDIKTKEEAVMSSRVRLLEESSLKNTKQLEEIKELLESAAKNKAQIEGEVKEIKSIKETPALIVVEKPEAEEEQNADLNTERWSEVTKRAIQSKAGVSRSFTNRSGQTVFVCNSEKSKKALLPHVEQVFTNRKINTPKPRLPTISVPFIHGKYEKEELLNVLGQQNEGIQFNRENTQVLFFTPMRNKDNLHQAVMRVSEEIRDKIKANDNRLCIGINSCPVYDRFFVKRCNRCQSFHHFHKDNGGCKETQVCALCAENHETRGCTTDENFRKCTNCIKAGETAVDHPAFSLDCPCYVAEQNKLKKNTSYYSKNQ